MVRAFQGATMALKTCAGAGRRRADRPGARRRLRDLPARRSRAGGGGDVHRSRRSRRRTDSRRRRHERNAAPRDRSGGRRRSTAASCSAAFETMALGKVSTSAPDARRLGYLRDVDGITMNRERVMSGRASAWRWSARERLPAAGAAGRPSPLAARMCTRCSRSASTWRSAPAAPAITTRSSAARSRGFSPAATCRIATTVSEDVSARPRARGVPEPVRRAQDARADRLYAQDRKDAEELR